MSPALRTATERVGLRAAALVEEARRQLAEPTPHDPTASLILHVHPAAGIVLVGEAADGLLRRLDAWATLIRREDALLSILEALGEPLESERWVYKIGPDGRLVALRVAPGTEAGTLGARPK